MSIALLQWRGRAVWPVDLSSAELSQYAREIHERSVFSARTTNADYLNEISQVVDDMLSGKIAQSEGRWRLMRKLKQLDYDPVQGFPGDVGAVPPAERGALQDLSSEQRVDLVIETNMRMAANYGQLQAGNTDYARYAYPAWELVRLYSRDLARGERRGPDGSIVADPANGWPRRWQQAGGELHAGRMIALKDSPVWPALGNGAGDHNDALGNPYPPFAFRSGMGWRAVKRTECAQLGLIGGDARPAAVQATLSPGQRQVSVALARMAPDLRAELDRELGLAA